MLRRTALLLLLVLAAAPARAAADVRGALQKAMALKDPRERIRAVQAGLEGADSPEAAKAVVELLFQPDEPQAMLDVGVGALVQMQSPGAPAAAVKAAGTTLRRVLVAEAFGRSEAGGTLSALTGLARCEELRARAAAVNALAERKDAGRQDALAAALEDPEWTVRSAAIRGIGRLGDKAQGHFLTWTMRRSEGRQVDDAAAALANLFGARLGPDPNAYERRMDPPLEGAFWKAPDPSFASPLFESRSRRILFVLQTSETMRDAVPDPAHDERVVAQIAQAGKELADDLRAAKTKIDVARVHLRAMLRSLANGVRFDVMTYADSPVYAFGDLTEANDASRRKAEARIAKLTPGGQPNLDEALLRIFDPRAKDPFEAPDGPDTVVFFGDGTLPTRGSNDRTEIVPRALRWNRSRQVRFLVAAVGQSDPSVLGALSGGPPPGAHVEVP